MNKIFLTSLVLVLSLFLSCKKGEDDPGFTLLSRKARLEGDWKFTTGTITIGVKDSTGAYNALNYQLKNTQYIYDEIGRGAHFEEPFSFHLLISRNGSLSFKETMDSLTFEADGKWDFDGKTKDYKNKERVTIQLEGISGPSTVFRFFNKGQTHFTYTIRELRRKKLVLATTEEMILLDKSGGVYVTSEYTFVQ